MAKEKTDGRRYDASRDPRLSVEAADSYYARREALLRKFQGGDRVDGILKGLKSGKDPLLWINEAQINQLGSALPLIAGFLKHPAVDVQTTAAVALCSFNDARGYDFILEQLEGPDSQQWWGVFENDFAVSKPVSYLPRLQALAAKKTGSNEAALVAKVMAQLGDPQSWKYLANFVQTRPDRMTDVILTLGKIDDPGINSLMEKLANGPAPQEVKDATDVYRARKGDQASRQRILDSVRRLTALPDPQDLKAAAASGPHPDPSPGQAAAWDQRGFLALEHGIEAVPPEQAEPVLLEVAMYAKNIRFSRMAVVQLAKIGDDSAREALWQVARSALERKPKSEDTMFTLLGMGLMLFSDPTSESLAKKLFNGYEPDFALSELFAETRGWEGLFLSDTGSPVYGF